MLLTSTHAGGLNEIFPLKGITGETPEILEYLDFGFYDRCWYHYNAGLIPPPVGRWLGMSHRIVSAMSYWILTKTGNVISRTTVQQVTNLEIQTDTVKDGFDVFNTEIHRRIKEDDFAKEGENLNPKDWLEFMNHNKDFQLEFDWVFNDDNILEEDNTFTPDKYDDDNLNMELAIPKGNDGP